MKLIILALYLVIGTASYAGGIGPDRPQLNMESFYNTFPDAKEVKWELQKDKVRITFHHSGETLYAYYSNEGELLAVSRNIQVFQLPMLAATNLNKELGDKTLTNLFEMSVNGETSYYATFSNDKYETILKAQFSGEWTVFKKVRRKGL